LQTADHNEGIEVYLPKLMARFDRAATRIEDKLDMLVAHRSRPLLQDIPALLIIAGSIGIFAALCALPIVLAISMP
jgi:hypothetical protein